MDLFYVVLTHSILVKCPCYTPFIKTVLVKKKIHAQVLFLYFLLHSTAYTVHTYPYSDGMGGVD